MRVRPQIEQQPHHPRPVLRRGVVERRATVLVAGHARGEQRRVARDEAAHLVGAVERNRGPEIEPRAVAQEILRHVLARAPEAGRPAEHADLVVIALAVERRSPPRPAS